MPPTRPPLALANTPSSIAAAEGAAETVAQARRDRWGEDAGLE